MSTVELKRRRDGKVSLTLAANGHDIIRIPNPDITPHRSGSQRARAWQIVSLMDGLTVRQGTDILGKLEYNIQRANGRPLGWIADAVSDGYAEIHQGKKPQPSGSKICPALPPVVARKSTVMDGTGSTPIGTHRIEMFAPLPTSGQSSRMLNPHPNLSGNAP